MNDLRYAFRMLRKSPGFTIVAVLTLALGIGVNTNIFGMVNAFFLSPLNVPRPEQLVLIVQRSAAWNMPHGHSYLDYRDYQERATSFTDIAATLPTPAHVGAAGDVAERTWIEVVSPNYFEVARIDAALGRVFHPERNNEVGPEPVAVLTHDYWQRRFGGDRAMVGRTIQLNGNPFTVIGVTPRGFGGMHWSLNLSAIVPAPFASQLFGGQTGLLTERGAPAWRLVARLKDGVTLHQARADVGSVASALHQQFPDQHKGSSVSVVPESRARPDPAFADFMPFFTALFVGLVALVLFIACANVANLMFARALARRRELTVRAALGASRGLLVRQLLVESLVLAAAAGIAGFFLANWAGGALSAFAPKSDMPLNMDHPNDWRIYTFTAVIALLAGLAAGLLPALRASRVELHEGLKEAAGGRHSQAKHPFRNLLVVSQVTLSLIVLICAGLFLHSLSRFKHVALGFQPDRLLMVSLDLGLQGYSDDRGRLFLEQLVDRARSLPGVRAASLTRNIPFDYGITITEIAPEGRTDEPAEAFQATSYAAVEAAYFETMGTVLLRGRAFTPADRAGSLRVAVINETLARKLWPDKDAVGKRFQFRPNGPWIEVVGVAANGKYVQLGEDPRPYFFMPLAQEYSTPVSLVMRTDGDPAALTAPVRDLVRRLDPDLPVYNARTLDDHIRNSAFGLMPIRLGAMLSGVQGLLGVLLAVMGLYAVVAYGVEQRTHEIGIRMALGARGIDVVRLVVGEGLRLISVGLALGLIVAVGIAFVLSRFLFGVQMTDVSVYVVPVLFLLGVAALACYLPARRATHVDPIAALRCE